MPTLMLFHNENCYDILIYNCIKICNQYRSIRINKTNGYSYGLYSLYTKVNVIVHELSLMQEVFKIIEEQVKVNKVSKVHQVCLKVGKMTAIVPTSLSFCFEILSKGTMLEGAKLEIEEVPVRCKCKECGEEFIVDSFIFICPECKSTDLEQLSGNEFMVHNMEVD